MAVERMTSVPEQNALPLSPKERLNSTILPLIFELSTTIIKTKEFQEAYRGLNHNGLEWVVSYKANEDTYRIESKLVPNPEGLSERTLKVTRTSNLSPDIYDSRGNVLPNEGPFKETQVLLSWSKENPQIYYSEKRKNRKDEETRLISEAKGYEATENVKKFIHMTKLLTHEVGGIRNFPNSRKAEIKKGEPKPKLEAETVQSYDPKFAEQEEWARENNRTYQKRLEKERKMTHEWNERLKKIESKEEFKPSLPVRLLRRFNLV